MVDHFATQFFFCFFFVCVCSGHNVPFLKSASLRKRKRIKQKYKVSKKGNKKKIMPSGPKGGDRPAF